MGRVRAVPVIPYLVLVVRVDDGLGGSTKRRGSRPKQGLDEWLEGSDDEDRNRVGNLIDERRHARDTVNGVLVSSELDAKTAMAKAHLDTLHDRVSEAQNLPQCRVELLRGHLTRVESAWSGVCSHPLNVVHVPAERLAIATR